MGRIRPRRGRPTSSRQIKVMEKRCNGGGPDPHPPNLGGAEPLHNPISAHGVGDASTVCAQRGIDSSGDTQQKVGRLNETDTSFSLCLTRGDSSRVGVNRSAFCPQVNFQCDLGLWKDEASGFMIHTLCYCFLHRVSSSLGRQHLTRIAALSLKTPDNAS